MVRDERVQDPQPPSRMKVDEEATGRMRLVRISCRHVVLRREEQNRRLIEEVTAIGLVVYDVSLRLAEKKLSGEVQPRKGRIRYKAAHENGIAADLIPLRQRT